MYTLLRLKLGFPPYPSYTYILLYICSFYEISRSETPSVVLTTINEYISVCVITEKPLVLACTGLKYVFR